MLARYLRLQQLYPVRTQIASSLAIWTAGDSLVQYLEHRHTSHSLTDASDHDGDQGSTAGFELDGRRALGMGVFGGAVIGFLGHHFYENLDHWAKLRYPASRFKYVGVKCLLDAALFNPVYTGLFFLFLRASGELVSWAQLKGKFQADYFPTLAAECTFWPPVQMINFSFVPLRHQVLFVNAACVLDAAFLSWSGHQEAWFDHVMAWASGRKSVPDAEGEAAH